ncbi:MAG: SlyX family protein [Xanthomonadaceae bacterium]|nr:SlyX family protein [Xanthomonadaceae bacterium]
MSSSSERLTELEIRIAHLEAALQTLSDELAAQHRHHDTLLAEMRALTARVAAADSQEPEPPDQRPPHY